MKTPLVSGETKRVAREDEHEPVAIVPDAVRAVTARDEPQATGSARHAEHAGIAAQAGNV